MLDIVLGAGDTKMDNIQSLASSIFSGYQMFFRECGQNMKGIFVLNVREEKALNTEVAVILDPLTYGTRIIDWVWGGGAYLQSRWKWKVTGMPRSKLTYLWAEVRQTIESS